MVHEEAIYESQARLSTTDSLSVKTPRKRKWTAQSHTISLRIPAQMFQVTLPSADRLRAPQLKPTQTQDCRTGGGRDTGTQLQKGPKQVVRGSQARMGGVENVVWAWLFECLQSLRLCLN